MADAKGHYCQNCGSELVDELATESLDNEGKKIVVSAKGTVGICPNCNMANSLNKDTETGPSTDSPGAEVSPRGMEGPERVEDTLVPEGADFTPAPTTSPEVPLEDSIPEGVEVDQVALADTDYASSGEPVQLPKE